MATLPGRILSGVLLGGREEPGWRGFARARRQPRSGALGASLLVAAMWVTWHAPLFGMPGPTRAGFPTIPDLEPTFAGERNRPGDR